jgi:hypothetical protein
MKQLLHDLGINLGLSFAGFAGSLVMIGKKDFSWKKALVSIPSGVFSANYLTPLVVDALGMNGGSAEYGIAFIMGYLGLKGTEIFATKFISNEKFEKSSTEKGK